MMTIVSRARADIVNMKGYSSARSLHRKVPGTVFLDANECPFEPVVGMAGLSRYPEQQPRELVDALCRYYDVSSRNMMIARGADEAIDLLVRAFCTPDSDNVIICPPTFPMYEHSAVLQGAGVKRVPLTKEFGLNVTAIKEIADPGTKLIFVCSPNNPTANLMEDEDIAALCNEFEGTSLVVVDETYIEFTGKESHSGLIEEHANLAVVRTLSKSLAAAALRCGVLLARTDVIDLLLKVLPPYPIPEPVVRAALTILAPGNQRRLAFKRSQLLATKRAIVAELECLDEVEHVYPSEVNFVLMRVRDAQKFTKKCQAANIIVRDQSYQAGLSNCVRLSIGTLDEMQLLVAVLRGDSTDDRSKDRMVSVTRQTKETAISVSVNLDKTAPISIETSVPFLDHMLEQVARHGGFSLQLECKGDLEIEAHHTVEDCAIVLGEALRRALGDKRGIGRYGSHKLLLPMDEAQTHVALDIGGRSYLRFEGKFPDKYVGNKSNPLPVDMVEHVFRSLAENLQATLHISVSGQNTHHMVETCFKGLGRALRQAIRVEGQELPSTKGTL